MKPSDNTVKRVTIHDIRKELVGLLDTNDPQSFNWVELPEGIGELHLHSKLCIYTCLTFFHGVLHIQKEAAWESFRRVLQEERACLKNIRKHIGEEVFLSRVPSNRKDIL